MRDIKILKHGEYRLSHSREILMIKNIDNDVAVCVFGEDPQNQRALCRISEDNKKTLERFVDYFLEKHEDSHPRAIVSSIPRYSNCFTNCVRGYLELRGIKIRHSDSTERTEEMGNIRYKDLILIPEKRLGKKVIEPPRLRIVYKNKEGRFFQDDIRVINLS